ncbi:TldD/PmbA family protein [Sporosarcina pasteurii]|uniref:Peptidase PmbA n=1 Tax=Sporosarcina pasteurii TaxID=1474 RepID=A0A380CJU2_SPOPA|nr:TldD/PmbA family protein [Sporosarcina pasteurii]MDS9471916.1 TldD/PmbA family protein [Sporosarcina pasteurii]QBQ06648.1 TldD/PmbA family protein [Sporosarcina pasteurii]SUJ21947.1 peptidase PmbA [Sporosarcina pasteurii]
MLKNNEFQSKLLAEAKNAGFSEAEIYYEKSSSFHCTIFEGAIDSYETAEEGGIGFRGLYNGKMGYAYTEKVDDDSIAFLIHQAKENASILDEDDGTTIFEGSEQYNTHSFYNEALANVPNEEKIALIQSIEKKVLAYDPRIVTLNYCVIQDFSTERAIANDKGLSIDEKRNGLVVFVSAVAKDGEEMKTGSAVKMTRDFNSIDADVFTKEVAEEALSHLGEQSIPTKKYPVVMRHDASASLLSTFSPIYSAENTQKDQSLLKGKVGQTIASSAYTLVDDPSHPDSLRGTNFDGEGVATKKQTIVSEGKLETLFHNRKTAQKDGVETTGHARKSSYKGTLSVAPINLYIAPGLKSKEDLIASIQDGVLITGLAGLHSGANTISGDFSVAATGFHIQDGQITAPVKQMTIAGNYFDYLKQIEEVGADLEFSPGGYGSPSLLVKELSVTVDH